MHDLLNIVLVGVLIVYLLSKAAKRPLVLETAPSKLPLSQPADPLPREAAPVVAPARPEPAVAVHASVPSAASENAPRYILGGRGDAGEDDRVQSMLDVMSGPGVCTPRHR